MSLRTRLFVVFMLLLAGSTAAQWMLLDTLASDFSQRLGAVTQLAARALPGGEQLTARQHDEITQRVWDRLAEDHDVIIEGLAATSVRAALDVIGSNGGDVRAIRLPLDSEPGERIEIVVGPEQRSIPVVIDHTQYAEAIARVQGIRLLGMGVISFLALGLGWWSVKRTCVSLSTLASVASRVGAGELGVQAPVQGPREIRDAIVAFNDMSTRIKELDRARARVRSLAHLAELGEMATAVVHSLRNPLNTLGLTIRQLESTHASTSSGELTDMARRSIDRMNRVLRSVLAWGRNDSAATETMDIREIIDDVALEAAQTRPGEVGVDYDRGDRALIVRVVAPELRAGLHAVVINAVEAAPSQTRVTIEAVCDAGQVHVHVRDRGDGLPADLGHAAFRPYPSAKSSGAGLGLFLAQRIVSTRYQGALRVERSNATTTVTLTIADRTDDAEEEDRRTALVLPTS